MKQLKLVLLMSVTQLLALCSKAQVSPISISTGTVSFDYNYCCSSNNNCSTICSNTFSSPTHVFSWIDASNQTRSAVMVNQTKSNCGFLRQFTYKVSGVDRVCAGTGSNYNDPIETLGDGFIQNHTGYSADNESTSKAGTTSNPLSGRHHAIIQFDIPSYLINSGSGKSGTVPSTIQWFFATGRDYPIYSLTQDARGTNGDLGGDSRSPYGDMHYDGTPYSNGPWGGDNIGGISMGDTYKWVSVMNGSTNESTLLTTNSGWRYNEPNTIPYAMEWTQNVNAEQGHVQTQPISIKDAGRTDMTSTPIKPNSQKLNGPMLLDEQWPYQIAAYDILSPSGGNTKRLTWGTNFGAIGGFAQNNDNTDFTLHYNGQRTTGGKGLFLAYSVADVFGLHTPNGVYNDSAYKTGAVGKVITQMENMQLATLSATVGSVITTGPAGVQGTSSANVPTVTYVPAGYNHIYATWEVDAAADVANLTLTPHKSNPIENPVFVINNYKVSTTPKPSICIGSKASKADIDYFLTIDSVNSKLWITVNSSINTALNLQVNTGACNTLLPVVLEDFKATEQYNTCLLSWQTNIASNDIRFEIQRSIDGIGFTTLTTLQATSNDKGNYHVTDNKPAKGVNYYRLEIVDKYGAVTYSKVVSVQLTIDNYKLSIIPNPARDVVTVMGNNIASVQVIDNIGRVVKVVNLKDATNPTLSVSGLQAGFYHLHIQTSDGKFSSVGMVKE